ncbi:hypothetical protein N5923_23370 [Erwiniaceae bacterium BAC15a-03b]|uniref:Uncharacterized protein n=1 Tax=Winslowiella arboricola TaxID=2978220 RepID=A0A9J6PZU6_9GAMM|nr:hypothetical protein [Winslowiella arboricola]MCU5775110.1 hypothetical protein [Winslowiella arboricola]MCU5780436.1 hypothetical protein [Winslowiella arboricola]
MGESVIKSYDITVNSEESTWNHKTKKNPTMSDGLLIISEDDGSDAVYFTANLVGYHVKPVYEK